MNIGRIRRDKTLALSTSFLHSPEADVQSYCQQCNQDGSRIPAYGYCQECAEYLCETCYNYHKKQTQCRNHVLLDKTQMVKTMSQGKYLRTQSMDQLSDNQSLHQPLQTENLYLPSQTENLYLPPQTQSLYLPPQTQSQDEFTMAHDLTEECEQHAGQIIEYFCQDHNKLGCSRCMMINHRTCTLDCISIVSEDFTRSAEYKHLLHSLKSLHASLKHITNIAKANKGTIPIYKTTVKEEIKHFRNEIKCTLDKWEADTDKRAASIFREDNAKAESAVTFSQEMSKEIESLQVSFTSLEKATKHNAIFIKAKLTDETVEEYNKIVEDMQHILHGGYMFQPNLMIQDLLHSESSIGELHRQPLKLPGVYTDEPQQIQEQPPPMEPIQCNANMPAELSDNLNVKSDNDASGCVIPGIEIISKDQLAITDSHNNCIKIIDIKQQKVVSKMVLSSYPWDVTLLPGDKLAITLPNENKIQILSFVGSDLLAVTQLEDVGHRCCGIAYMEGNLIVTFGSPDKVQIMTMEGQVLKTIKLDINGKELFRSCQYVATGKSNRDIYVSDFSNGSITRLSQEGEITGVIKPQDLIGPTGMVVLENGSILVCSNMNRSIHLISQNFIDSTILLQDYAVSFPQCLAFNAENEKLYVGSGAVCNYINTCTINWDRCRME